MDDGSPVPANITIQSVCAGATRSVAYTDSKGHFSFQWGQTNTGVMADASEPGIRSRLDQGGGGFGTSSAASSNPFSSQSASSQMWGCELRAEAAGFQSGAIMLVNRTGLDNPDVGTITLHRMANVEGTSISATSYLAPKDAQKAYERGLQSVLKSKPADAAKDFEKAVASYPKYAVAWVSLGKIRLQEKAYEPAREAFLKAIDADAKLVSPYVELGLLAAQEQKWELCGQFLDKALKLDPIDFPRAWFIDAVANYNTKKFDAAEKSAREAMKLDPKHTNPRSQYLLALALIEKHNYEPASVEMKAYLKADPNAADFAKIKDQSDRLEKFLQDSQEAAK